MCNHDRYREMPYVSDEEAMSLLRAKNEYCWMGMVVTHCADCDADISHGRWVEVKSFKQIMGEM